MTMAAGWMKGFVVCLILKLAVSQLSAEVPEQQPVQVPVQEPFSVLDLQQSNDLCEEGLESLTVFPETKDCHDICIASGDPHFNTFDCVTYEYHGRCSYTLAKNCGGDLEDFEIIGEFHRMRYHRDLSIIKSLLITVSGTNIKMDAKFNVFINSDRVTTAATTVSFAHIQRYCNAVVVTMTNGITIYWSSPYRAMIKINSDVDATLAGNLCGLCGNNNDIKFDDLTARNKSLVSDVVVLGDSWRTNGKCGLCNDCENNLCENNPQNSKIAQTFCKSFFLQDRIMPCGDKDPAEWYEKCENILCAALPETDGFCYLVNLYMDVCAGVGIQIQIKLPESCYATGTEIVLNDKPTSQSSVAHNGIPPRAVDGNGNGNWIKNTCTHTADSNGAWWKVNMVSDGEPQICVGKVVVFNRVDCCEKRLTNAIIRVGDSENHTENPECGQISTADINESSEIEIACNLKGRYLSVNLPERGILTLCEVKIFAGDCSV